jgi:uncharacterized membrane protein YfhO
VARNAFRGWEAQVDDKTVRVSKTKDGWIELEIPKNAQRLSLVYFPPGLVIGSILSVCGLLLSAGLLFFSKKFPMMLH